MSYLPNIDPTVVIRAARGSDGDVLERLARLDSQRPPAGDVLLAEQDGIVVAALAGDRAIADPFRPTADLVALLRVHAGRAARATRPAPRARAAPAHGVALRSGRPGRRVPGWPAESDLDGSLLRSLLAAHPHLRGVAEQVGRRATRRAAPAGLLMLVRIGGRSGPGRAAALLARAALPARLGHSRARGACRGRVRMTVRRSRRLRSSTASSRCGSRCTNDRKILPPGTLVADAAASWARRRAVYRGWRRTATRSCRSSERAGVARSHRGRVVQGGRTTRSRSASVYAGLFSITVARGPRRGRGHGADGRARRPGRRAGHRRPRRRRDERQPRAALLRAARPAADRDVPVADRRRLTERRATGRRLPGTVARSSTGRSSPPSCGAPRARRGARPGARAGHERQHAAGAAEPRAAGRREPVPCAALHRARRRPDPVHQHRPEHVHVVVDAVRAERRHHRQHVRTARAGAVTRVRVRSGAGRRRWRSRSSPPAAGCAAPPRRVSPVVPAAPNQVNEFAVDLPAGSGVGDRPPARSTTTSS